MTGKKLGIVAFICAILFTVFSFVNVSQEPELPEEFFEVAISDMERAIEIEEEALENASTLYKVSSIAITIFGLAGIVLAIIALVKMAKGGEKGKIIPVLAIVAIIVFYIVAMFASPNNRKAFQAGLEAGMEMTEQ